MVGFINSSIKGKNFISFFALNLCVILLFLMTGCSQASNEGNSASEESTTRVDTGFVVYGPDSYDSADTPVLVAKDEEAKTMTFLNLQLGKRYTLEYDGTSTLYDKYGNSLTLEQVEIGEIVDICFIKSKKHLTSLAIAKDSWKIDSTTRYIIDSVKKDVTIGEETYNISSDISLFSQDREIELMDLVSTDTLTFRGIGTSVLSVVVENGHGYLRLSGIENFVDGWIEIGNSIIERVTEEMLLTVPEGTYQVKISNRGTTAEKSVKIFRNSESTLDFGDIVFEDPKVGTVLFSVSPSNAELYIDGELKDTGTAIELTYGLHQLICRASGYTSVTQYLNVGQASAGIDIVLEKVEDSDDDSEGDEENSTSEETKEGDAESQNTDNKNTDSESSDTDNNGSSSGNNTDSSSTNPNTLTTYYRVHIDAPENVEVYVDGSYVGVSPCSFKKVEGSHIVTLSRDGYATRSYTIYVDSEDKDISFSFVDLVAQE